MAQLPNLINATVINGKSNYIKQTTEVVEILSNPKGSGKVMKVRRKNTTEVYAMKVLRKDMIVKENMVSHT